MMWNILHAHYFCTILCHRAVSVCACVYIFARAVQFCAVQAWTAACLFCRVSVRTFHLLRPLMAGVRASALIRVLWTCHLIAEEAEQVIAFESLIVQTRKKKQYTRQGGSHGRRSHVAYSWSTLLMSFISSFTGSVFFLPSAVTNII